MMPIDITERYTKYRFMLPLIHKWINRTLGRNFALLRRQKKYMNRPSKSKGIEIPELVHLEMKLKLFYLFCLLVGVVEGRDISI